MASVHPDLFLNIDQKVTALAFLDKNASTPIKILVGTSEGSVQIWDFKSQRLEKSFAIFDSTKTDEEYPILWIGTFIDEGHSSTDDSVGLLFEKVE